MGAFRIHPAGLPAGVNIPVVGCWNLGEKTVAGFGSIAPHERGENLKGCLQGQAMVHYGQATYDAPAGTVPVWTRAGDGFTFQSAGGSSAPGAIVWERKSVGSLIGKPLAGLANEPWSTGKIVGVIAVALAAIYFARRR